MPQREAVPRCDQRAAPAASLADGGALPARPRRSASLPAQGSRALLPGPTREGGVVPGSRMERKRQRQSRASFVVLEANPSASCRKSKFDFPTNPSTQMKVLIELMNTDMKSTPYKCLVTIRPHLPVMNTHVTRNTHRCRKSRPTHVLQHLCVQTFAHAGTCDMHTG